MLLIFDFDGTLFETATGLHKAVNLTLTDINHPELPFEVIMSCIGGGLRQLVKKINHEHLKGPLDVDELITRFRHHYKQTFIQDSEPMEGAEAFLQQWQGSLAIASNKEKYFVDELLKHSSLGNFEWKEVYGGDSVAQKKPHPMMLEEILNKTGYSAEQSIMIGDGLPDVLAAKNVNMKCIAVDFGYHDSQELLQAGAHTLIKGFEELPAAIEKCID